jgi:hypothetical protein
VSTCCASTTVPLQKLALDPLAIFTYTAHGVPCTSTPVPPTILDAGNPPLDAASARTAASGAITAMRSFTGQQSQVRAGS